jgi:acetyl-CoA synthetase
MAQDGSSEIEIFYGGGTMIPPSPEFAASANATEDLVRRVAADPIGYWEDEARKLSWFQSWDKALEWNAADAKWFVGGKLNVSYNCLDRHVEARRGSRVAYR